MLANYRKLPYAGYLEPVVMTGGPVSHTKLIVHSGKEKAKIYMFNSKYHLEGICQSLFAEARRGHSYFHTLDQTPPLGKVILLHPERAWLQEGHKEQRGSNGTAS